MNRIHAYLTLFFCEHTLGLPLEILVYPPQR